MSLTLLTAVIMLLFKKIQEKRKYYVTLEHIPGPNCKSILGDVSVLTGNVFGNIVEGKHLWMRYVVYILYLLLIHLYIK